MITLATFASLFITSILAVIVSITHPVLANALAIGASELVASAGVILAIVFITIILTVVVVVTDIGAKDTLSTATFKFFVRAHGGRAVGFIRGVPAINPLVTLLARVVTGSIVTGQLIACWVMAVPLVRAVGTVADAVTLVFHGNTLTVGACQLLA